MNYCVSLTVFNAGVTFREVLVIFFCSHVEFILDGSEPSRFKFLLDSVIDIIENVFDVFNRFVNLFLFNLDLSLTASSQRLSVAEDLLSLARGRRRGLGKGLDDAIVVII